jgi:3-dehydroquinate synthase
MSGHHTLTVALAERSYEIHIGHGLLADAGALLEPVLASKRVIVVSDSNVAPLYAPALEASLARAGVRCDVLTVAAGEGTKGFATLETLLEQMLALAPDRKTTVIALGGGVVGDLAGFAASVLLRGVPFVQIPTTLLAQVDSSVGGKTAINSRAGKNLVGSFYQPQRVLIDLDTLATLPARELRAGYAEIIKYGLIMSAEFYRWCIMNGGNLLAGEPAALAHAVSECCRMKAEIVGADEREAGSRALLNFGHTFGHALEAETGMSEKLLHGEAVAIGLVMACRMSAHLGLISADMERELAAHFTALGLPSTPRDVAHDWNAERIAAHFASDKKTENGALTFVLLDAVGAARVVKDVDASLALKTVTHYTT